MKDKVGYMFQCPACKKVLEGKNSGGVVCTDCHLFMKRVIPMDAFESNDDIEIKIGEKDGSTV